MKKHLILSFILCLLSTHNLYANVLSPVLSNKNNLKPIKKLKKGTPICLSKEAMSYFATGIFTDDMKVVEYLAKEGLCAFTENEVKFSYLSFISDEEAYTIVPILLHDNSVKIVFTFSNQLVNNPDGFRKK